MAIDIPAWAKDRMSPHAGKARKAQPITRQPLPAQGVESTARAVRSQTVARSHNTFRPDIYRVSEGYLN